MNLSDLIAKAKESGKAPAGAPAAVIRAADDAAVKLNAKPTVVSAPVEADDPRPVAGYVVSLGRNAEPDVYVEAADASDRLAAVAVAFNRLGIIGSEKQPSIQVIYQDSATDAPEVPAGE